MGKDIEFQFTKRTQHWAGGEARVFSVESEAEFPSGRELEGARLLTVVGVAARFVQNCTLRDFEVGREVQWPTENFDANNLVAENIYVQRSGHEAERSMARSPRSVWLRHHIIITASLVPVPLCDGKLGDLASQVRLACFLQQSF